MNRVLLPLLVLGVLCGMVQTQIWMDAFNYPPGPNLGTWKLDRGKWTCTGSMAKSEEIRQYQYLTQPGHLYQDCAIECYVEYNPLSTQALQFGGLTLRCNDPASFNFGGDLIVVKIQDNNSSGDFDSIWLYEHSTTGGLNSSAKTSITPTFTKATVRLLAIDNRVIAQVDSTGDGLWDHVLTKTVTLAVKPGPVGLAGYGGALMDDFELFDAILMDDSASLPPEPGNEIKFVLRGFPNAPYQAATALSTPGIVLPDGRIVPLALDDIFKASATNVLPGLFKNFRGTLDGTGDGAVSIALPNIPGLKGITLFTAFVNYNGGVILNISNDHQVTIQ